MNNETRKIFEQLKNIQPKELDALATAMALDASQSIRKTEDGNKQFQLANVRDAWYAVSRHAE